jgi:6-phosphogluconolactonase
MIYRLDASDASLVAGYPAFATVPAGAGPRQLAFRPDGTRASGGTEMACTLSAFAWDGSRGAREIRETVQLLPSGVKVDPKFSAAAIEVSPDGRFIYATVRGHDSVSVRAVGEDGKLSLLESVPCGGRTPRGLGLDPTGRWLLVGNQGSDAVSVFEIDAMTGRLSATGFGVPVGAPVDVKFAKVEQD